MKRPLGTEHQLISSRRGCGRRPIFPQDQRFGLHAICHPLSENRPSRYVLSPRFITERMSHDSYFEQYGQCSGLRSKWECLLRFQCWGSWLSRYRMPVQYEFWAMALSACVLLLLHCSAQRRRWMPRLVSTILFLNWLTALRQSSKLRSSLLTYMTRRCRCCFFFI